MEFQNKLASTWLIIILSVLMIGYFIWNTPHDQSGENNGSSEDQGQEVIWGVDSATYTTDDFYNCVVDHYGKPEAWGRYMGGTEGVSAGLDKSEVAFLHEKDISIIPIYNLFTDATGYVNGKDEAERALDIAETLEIEKGVYLFADIEPNYPVDAEFITGWTETITSSDYKSGIYGVFDEGSDLYNAFETAASENESAFDEVAVWTSYPQIEVTTKENAPPFKPSAPDSAEEVLWQYGIDGETCNIDTSLFKKEVKENLW